MELCRCMRGRSNLASSSDEAGAAAMFTRGSRVSSGLFSRPLWLGCRTFIIFCRKTLNISFLFLLVQLHMTVNLSGYLCWWWYRFIGLFLRSFQLHQIICQVLTKLIINYINVLGQPIVNGQTSPYRFKKSPLRDHVSIT